LQYHFQSGFGSFFREPAVVRRRLRETELGLTFAAAVFNGSIVLGLSRLSFRLQY